MSTGDTTPYLPADLVWFTSSYSNNAGGECVECARTLETVYVRDSKRGPDGPALAMRSETWSLFIASGIGAR
ncbi:DUF397 domain-containing protein [Streptomyces venezuelae]|uniref:DUF397 domain-containing protein n=1 Tax=Streptomyces venezuelae TaxID=54571 RepID=A0A5P2C151_STRVZ|nr:DUF397 domain-containing protein [Streptomyces venezuelae]QES36187.1 DUF397 domain-containing protein [Streptomyces venezuelae]